MLQLATTISKPEAGNKRLGSEVGGLQKSEAVVRMRHTSSQSVTSSVPLSLGVGNKVLVNKDTPFGQKSLSRQYAIKNTIRDSLLETCSRDEKMTDAEILDFLNYTKREVNCEARQLLVDQQQLIIESALEGRSLQQRNELIRLMTHTASGRLNDDMLEIFPALRERSVELLTAAGRKQRVDKIDTRFIVDYMHANCRYTCVNAPILIL